MKAIVCFQVVLILIRIVLDAIANETFFRERKNIFFFFFFYERKFSFYCFIIIFFQFNIYLYFVIFNVFVMLGIDV